MTPASFIDDPDWASFIPEMGAPAKQRSLPSHEDCTPIDTEKVQFHLRKGGTLGAMPGYEERPGQIDMSGAIASAFNCREHLMIEAGTGVGKSLAYLIPSIMWSWENDTPVVISTATRNLQSQLIDSDIPRALAVLGDNRGKFKVALLKGRGNYLCLRSVAEFFAPGYWTMTAQEQAEMPNFIEWLQQTDNGDLDGYDGLPRAQLTCPAEECGGRRCPFYSKCFVYKARKAAAEANLVVVNHALVLSEASSPTGGILPNYGWLVMDEAHNLEDIATEYLGYELSMPELTRILNRLRRRRRGKRMDAGGTLAAIERQFRRGAFAGIPEGLRVLKAVGDIAVLTVKIVGAAERFFDMAERLLAPAPDMGVCRYRVKDGVRSYSIHGLFKSYEREEWDESSFIGAQANLEEAIAAMVNRLHELGKNLEDAVPEGELNYLGDFVMQLNGIADSLVEFANSLNFVLRGERDSHAYWVERVREDRRVVYVRLVAAPLSVAEDLRKLFYDRKDSVVLCSATLRVGSDFRYMAKRLGCEDRFQMLTAKSPFDYFRQSLVLAPDCLPDPSSEPAKYAQALASLMNDLFSATHGRAMVLFTSYEMMNAVADAARLTLENSGIRLLVQGDGLSRESLTRHLKDDANTVIFGAQSFWEGVDVAGDALSCVVIARLPFAMVGDPVNEARSEKIDRDGGSSFRDYALPSAVIRFRQGFGRLIRTKSDRGVVIVSDPRLMTKNYGAVFKKSIPATVHKISDVNDLLERVTEFFA